MGYLLRGASPHLAALAKRREIVRTDLAPFAFLVARGSSHLDYRRFFSSSLPTKLLCFYLPLPPPLSFSIIFINLVSVARGNNTDCQKRCFFGRVFNHSTNDVLQSQSYRLASRKPSSAFDYNRWQRSIGLPAVVEIDNFERLRKKGGGGGRYWLLRRAPFPGAGFPKPATSLDGRVHP